MLLHVSYCIACKKDTEHYDSKCALCLAKEHKKAEETWQAMTTDQKIENLRKRVESIETGYPFV